MPHTTDQDLLSRSRSTSKSFDGVDLVDIVFFGIPEAASAANIQKKLTAVQSCQCGCLYSLLREIEVANWNVDLWQRNK